MKKVYLISRNIDGLSLDDLKDQDVIGVDHGAEILARNQIRMVLAIGDFDSTDQFPLIQEYADEVITLKKEKMTSDMEEACAWAKDCYDQFYIYGGLGGRQDHQWSNLSLITKKDYPIIFFDGQNKIQRLHSGEYWMEKEGYTYFSFFPLKESVISLEGVKYPLENQRVDENDLYGLSNEILHDQAKIKLEGDILVFQSKDCF